MKARDRDRAAANQNLRGRTIHETAGLTRRALRPGGIEGPADRVPPQARLEEIACSPRSCHASRGRSGRLDYYPTGSLPYTFDVCSFVEQFKEDRHRPFFVETVLKP